MAVCRHCRGHFCSDQGIAVKCPSLQVANGPDIGIGVGIGIMVLRLLSWTPALVAVGLRLVLVLL